MLLVDGDGYCFSIIQDTDPSQLVDCDLDLLHSVVSLEVIGGINQDFIKDLVKAWAILDLLVDEAGLAF